MILGIDASNIRSGGGVTHLSGVLAAADPAKAGFERVVVWTSKATASRLPEQHWLVKHCPSWTDAGLGWRLLGQQLMLPRLVKEAGCGVLWSPGGTAPVRCPVPLVTTSQNMLPFEPDEARRFGTFNVMRLKMRLLRLSQSRSFRRSDGVIFLTRYAGTEIARALDGLNVPHAFVPHGIEPRFIQRPRPQRDLRQATDAAPIRLLYVSILMPYKHQIEVAHAAANLRARGVAVQVEFVGSSHGWYGRRFQDMVRALDPQRAFLLWEGAQPFEAVHRHYHDADIFVFASSCENLPNILMEAMASGLPIASSRKGPMPEVLGDAGVYFDPDDPASIEDAVMQLVESAELRARLAGRAWERAREYSWQQCADDTLDFVACVAKGNERAGQCSLMERY